MDWPTSLPFPVLLYSIDSDESPMAKWNKDALISKLGNLKLYVIIKMTMASSTYYRRQQVGLWMEQKHRYWKVNMTMLNRWENLFRSCFEKETEIWKAWGGLTIIFLSFKCLGPVLVYVVCMTKVFLYRWLWHIIACHCLCIGWTDHSVSYQDRLLHAGINMHSHVQLVPLYQ